MAETDLVTPLYARVLRLRHIHPGAAVCLGLFEGVTALAGLLAFAELTSWWAVLTLPLTVAVMVKINDIVAGVFSPVVATRDFARERVGRHAADPWSYVEDAVDPRVYGSPRPLDDDATPAVGWARRYTAPPTMPDKREFPNGPSVRLTPDADGVCHGRSWLNQRRFLPG